MKIDLLNSAAKFVAIIMAPLVGAFLVFAAEPIQAQAPASDPIAGTAWPMFMHDAQRTGRSDYSGPSIPRLSWSYYGRYSSPVVGADGEIFVGSRDDFRFYVFESSGTVAWSYRTGYWICTAPALGSDGSVYVASLDSYLYAFNSDGMLDWSYQAGLAGNYSSPAFGSDGNVYVGSGDNNI